MQQLCKDLGPRENSREDGEAQPESGGLLEQVRKLLTETRSREDDSATLHETMHGLIATVQEDLRKNTEAQSAISKCIFNSGLLFVDLCVATESVAGLIDRQRQDHEQLLRGVAIGAFLRTHDIGRAHVIIELSNEIRGERLRFVEAMKEATAINVQSKPADCVFGTELMQVCSQSMWRSSRRSSRGRCSR